MKSLKITAAMLLMFFATACGSSIPNAEKLNRRVSGVWKLSTGTIFSGLNLETFKYISFSEDGSGVEHNQYDSTKVLGCGNFLFAVLNDTTISMKLGLSIGLAKAINPLSALYQAPSTGNLYLYEKTDSKTLVLTDNAGNQLTLISAESVPENLQCQSFTVKNTFADLAPRPDDETNLVYDGESLWYTEYNNSGTPYYVYPINPADGEVGTAKTVSSPSGNMAYVLAFQSSGDFWNICGCGNDNETYLIDLDTPNPEQDKINTDTDLGNEISIESAAWDGTNLWLFGQNQSTYDYEFLKVDSAAEPDALLAAYAFDTRISAITWDGTNFWGISRFGFNQIVTRIDPDPAGFSSVATYYVPDPNIDWIGIAAVGDDLFLLGEDETKSENMGVITQITP